MALKEFIEKITRVESKMNLSDMQVYDFNPWPYVRLQILHKYNAQKTSGEASSKRSFFDRFIFFVKSMFLYISKPVKREKVDILYFTRQSECQESVHGKLINRYSDPFKYFFSNRFNVKVIEVNDQESVINKNDDTIHIDLLIKKARIKHKLLLAKNMNTAEINLHEMNKILGKEFGFNLDVNSDLVFIECLATEFTKILRAYNPKLVFLTVFYRLEAMAMCLACHRSGIKVVEYQHGAQNDYHAMYTHWNNVPKKGYELIPDIFWMWGDIPKIRIEKWALKTTKHKAVVGGSLWMSYQRINRKRASGVESYYIKGKVNVLVTLQGDAYFPLFLLDIIQTSPDTMRWHFRDHPRLPISTELRDKIKSLPNTELEFSSRASLYELLEHTSIHITGYSTIAFEAQNFDVPTIFVHVNALTGYKNLINRNGLFYAGDSESFNGLITQLLLNPPKIEPSYIISDVSVHNSALSLLME